MMASANAIAAKGCIAKFNVGLVLSVPSALHAQQRRPAALVLVTALLPSRRSSLCKLREPVGSAKVLHPAQGQFAVDYPYRAHSPNSRKLHGC